MKRIIFAIFYMISACCLITACGDQNSPQNAAQNDSSVATYSSDTPAINAPVHDTETPDNDNADSILPDKDYTYLGGLIISPDLYAKTSTGKVDDLQICGHEEPSDDGDEICLRYADLHGRLYDYNHVGLDVWDIRGDWYLVLAREALQPLWIQRPQADYRAYPDIVKKGLVFMGDWNYGNDPGWPTEAWTAPQGQKVTLDPNKLPAVRSANPMIRLIGAKIMPDKEVWFNVDVVNSLCEQTTTTPVIANVWYPAYHEEGYLRVPNFWFYSKGC